MRNVMAVAVAAAIAAQLAGECFCPCNGGKPFAVFPESCTTPDGMAIDSKGRLVVAAPNFNDTSRLAAIFRIDEPGDEPYLWVHVPPLAKTGLAAPMGICFGPEGELYVCDNQGWSGSEKGANEGRLLRLDFKDDKLVSCAVIAGGMEHPNGVKYHNGMLYVTQSSLSKIKDPSGRLVSGVYRFKPTDRNIAVKNTRDDPQLILTVVTQNPFCQYGLDGIVFDSKGNLFLGNFGDGTLHRVTFAAAGNVNSCKVFAKTDFDYSDPSAKDFLARAAKTKMRTTDGMCVDADDNIYVADFSNNAIAKVTPDGAVSVVRQDPDGNCMSGGLNQPGEPIIWKGRLVVSNFDAVLGPDKVNSRKDAPCTLSVVATAAAHREDPCAVWRPPAQGVYDLRCEYLAEPMGVVKPRFFWKWAGKRPERFTLTVAPVSHPALSSIRTGFCETREHLYVEPEWLMDLVPFSRYWWRVDDGGTGAEGTFVTGIEKWEKPFFKPPWQHDQREYWIARKKVTLKGAKSVIIALASLGSHRLYVNGKSASDCFGPNRSHVEDGILLAETYDVTRLVEDGENEFKVYMHDGWARLGQCKEQESCLSVDGRAVTDNGVVVIDSAEPWDVSLSADRSYGPIGKHNNGRKRGIEHLCDAERETRHARGVMRTGPEFSVSCDVSDRDYAIREIKPVSIEATATPGKWKIDMGEAFSGFMRLKLKGEKGTVARMTVSDTFVDECVFGQISEFEFCGGDGVFENRMNTQSGRFFYLTGCEKPRMADVTGIVIGCCGRITGGFSGDRDLETILALDRDTFIATTMCGVTVDCPHRERLGYGEASLSAMWGDGMPQFDSAAYYYAYLLKWASSQRPDGSIPHVSPNGYGWGGTFWSNFPVYALAEFCRRYPDARLKGIMRPVIDKWLDYLHSHVRADGILAQYEPKKGDCLGDWLYPEIHKTKGTSGDWGHTVEGMFFNNCSYAWAIKQALEINGLVTSAARRDELKRRHAALVKAIDREWYSDGMYVSEDARYQSIALLCGAAEAGGHNAETEKAMQDIVEWKGYVDGGSPSYTVILRALCMSKRGRELALRTFRRREAPGFLYFADEGYNTIPEDWWYGRKSRGSMIHTCYTGPAGALFHGFAGIEIDGNKITVAPLLSDALPNFSAYTETLYGTLYVKVESKGGRRVVRVFCPYGCKGTFVADGNHALRPGLNRFELPIDR